MTYSFRSRLALFCRSSLPPGRKTVRTFRLPDGARLLSGRRIRVGVIDGDGARLNRIMQIPILTEVTDADDS